jgi:hypothetical protein
MSHMAEYTCCSSVAFERPDENAFTFTLRRGKLGQLDGEAKSAYEARLLSAKVERFSFFLQRHLNSLRAASIARAGTLPEQCTIARTVRTWAGEEDSMPL